MKAEDFLKARPAIGNADLTSTERAPRPKALEFLRARPASENLPDTLNVAGFDTGIEIGPQLAASLASLGGRMIGSYRGAKQLLGFDEGQEAENETLLRRLEADPSVGTSAKVGGVVGSILDPVTIALPLGKAKTIAGMVKLGAVGGTTAGALNPTAEGEGLDTRAANAVMGAGLGAVGGAAIGGGINAVRFLRGKETIPLRARPSADLAIKGGAVPSPKEPLLLEYKPTPHEPLVVDATGNAGTEAQMFARRYAEQAADPAAVAYQVKGAPPAANAGHEATADALRAFRREQTKVLPFQGRDITDPSEVSVQEIVRERRAGGGTLGFLGGGQVKNAAKELAQTYQKYVGEPILGVLQRNPGASLGGAFGAASGYQSADDEAPVSEKIGRAVAGALLGVGAAKGFGKIPTGSGNLAESASRLFIDNYGLPAEYVAAKKARSAFTNQIQDQFLDVSRETAKLAPEQRRLLYNILEGTEPQAGDLAGLSDQARQTVTRWGQKMVDYGLLSPETFQKNAATYLHREYLSKLNPSTRGGVIRQIKMLGQELRPRGVFKTVPEAEASRWIELGWEPFGKARGGQQQVRWQLTKEQRIALGEIEDAAYAVARTGQLMSNDIATFKFFDDVAKAPQLASDVDPGGWVRLESGKLPKTQVNRFGNLEGKFVPPEIERDLRLFDMARSIRTSDNPAARALRAYQNLNAWWKVTKTALNPTVHTNNVLSNVMLYDLAGADYGNLAKAAMDMRRGGEAFKAAKALGVFDANMNAQELANISKKSLAAYADLADAPRNPIQAAVDFTKKVWDKTGGKMLDFYQKEDSVFRLGVFMDRLSKGATPEQAAADARRWFIDYEINAPGVNVLRQTATPFLAYTYRAVPLLTEAATMRPWKFAKWAAIGAGLNAVGEKYGGGDTAKERSLMSEQQKGNVFGLPFTPPQSIKLPTQALGEGARKALGIGDTSQYLDITRYIPGGDVFDIAGDRKMVPFLPAPAQPSFGAAGSTINAMTGYDPFRGKKLPGLGLSDAEDAKIKGKFLAQQFLPNNPVVPGSFSQDKITRAAFGEPSPAGDALPVWQAVLQTVGVKIRPADLGKMQMRAMLDTQRDVQAIQQQVAEAQREVQGGKVSQERFQAYAEERMTEAVRLVQKLQKKLSRSSSPEPLEAN